MKIKLKHSEYQTKARTGLPLLVLSLLLIKRLFDDPEGGC